MSETLTIDGREYARETLKMAAALIRQVGIADDAEILEVFQLAGLVLSRIKSVAELPGIIRVANLIGCEILDSDESAPEVQKFNEDISPGTAVFYVDEANEERAIGRTISPALKSHCHEAIVLIKGCKSWARIQTVQPCSTSVCEMLQREGC